MGADTKTDCPTDCRLQFNFNFIQMYEGVCIISGTGAAISTAVVVGWLNDR
jgi:hypothetical protein